MARIARNQLSLDLHTDGYFLLKGQFLGKQIRRRSHNFAELQRLKDSLEAQLAPASEVNHVLRSTWLSEDQLRDAEAATLKAAGRSLTTCVEFSRTSNEVARAIDCTTARDEWITHQRERLRRYPATLKKNETRVTAFLKATPLPKKLHEITGEQIEAWVLRPKISTYTQLTDGSVLRAFFAHAAKRGWVAKSPFAVDLRELAGRARHVELPRILTPKQCSYLFTAASKLEGGRLLPYLILSTWCFLRNAEVLRITPESIDWDAVEPAVTVIPRKRGTVSYRSVAIPAGALRRLRTIRKRGGWPDGQPVYWQRRAWDQARREAGLAELWQENILRHTGISYRYQQTGDIRLVCREAGNSSDTAFSHYLRLPAPGAAATFYRVP